MSIGKNIKKNRKNKGLTQKQLAERMGVTPQMISAYEKDLRLPKTETLQRIADALCIDVTNLFPSIQEFQDDINERITYYIESKDLCEFDWEKEILDFKIKLLENEQTDILLGQNTTEIYILPEHFQDILYPYIQLNDLGKLEANKRVGELLEISKYKKETE